jgi:hypothetical protein
MGTWNFFKSRRVAMICAAMLTGASAFAQSATVKGVVADSLLHQGEPYASVRIFRQKQMTKPTAVLVTDINGAFKQQVSGRGSYTIVISAVGRKDVTRDFLVKGSETVNMDTLYISDDTHLLKGVTVTAQKPLVKMEVDKVSYNVENDIDSKTNSALDMLRKVPMVTVDGNDNITVNGSSSFKVYVDGKPNVMLSSNPGQILKNMPASAIKNIEVVTNPGAKYDAEGVGGVLNIVMNKVAGAAANTNSMSTTVRTMLSNRGVGGSVYAAVQQGKFGLSVNANAGHTKMKDMKVSTSREQTGSTNNSTMDMDMKNTNEVNFTMGNMNMSYEIDSLRLLSATVGVMGFNDDMTDPGTTSFKGGMYGSGYGYNSNTTQKMSHYSVNGSVDYQRTFAGHKDRMLTLSYLISSAPNKTKSTNSFDTSSLSQLLNLSDRYTDIHNNTLEQTFQLDYSTPMNSNLTLDAGAKYILRNNSSHSDYYSVNGDNRTWDEAASMNYKHSNDILAGYGEMSAKVNKWSAKAGLRYEHTWQHVKYLLGKGDNFDMNYGNLVPSGNLSYKISETQNIGLAYNMRITRPGITMLNPYVNNSDPTTLSYGNTNLDCEKAHNISLVYNTFSPKWVMNLTLRHSFCNNAIENYSFYDSNNILNTTYGNVVKNQQTGLNAYINWNASANTRIMMNGALQYVDLKSDQLGLSNNGWQGNLMMGLQQTLPWKLRLSANVMTSTKSYTLQGYSTGINIVMGSLSRSFINDRLNVTLTGVTPMWSENIEMKTMAKGKDFISHSVTNLPLRSVMLSFSYTIGGQKNIKKAQHTIVNDDLKQQQSQTETITNIMR